LAAGYTVRVGLRIACFPLEHLVEQGCLLRAESAQPRGPGVRMPVAGLVLLGAFRFVVLGLFVARIVVVILPTMLPRHIIIIVLSLVTNATTSSCIAIAIAIAIAYFRFHV